MAKKPTSGKASSRRTKTAKQPPKVANAAPAPAAPAAGDSAGKPSSLLDTRVLKKTGSFYYHCDDHASADRMPT